MIGRCATCGDVFDRPTVQQVSDALWTHHHAEHVERPEASIHQLAQVTFREQALTAIRALACTGKPFTIGEAHDMVTVAPINPRTEWASVTREARDRGWITEHGYTTSVVPTTRSSAVKLWLGTSKAAAA